MRLMRLMSFSDVILHQERMPYREGFGMWPRAHPLSLESRRYVLRPYAKIGAAPWRTAFVFADLRISARVGQIHPAWGKHIGGAGGARGSGLG